MNIVNKIYTIDMITVDANRKIDDREGVNGKRHTDAIVRIKWKNNMFNV